MRRDRQPDQLRIAMVVPPWYEMPPRGYGGLETIVSALVDALVGRGHDGRGVVVGLGLQHVRIPEKAGVAC